MEHGLDARYPGVLLKEAVYRKFHQNQLTFNIWYAFFENFVLPLSHDEVVYGKGSLLHKMPGDDWQKFANLRLLLGYMFGEPGKKLIFMGGEIGQRDEWYHEQSIAWDLLENPAHQGVQKWVQDLNRLYREDPAMHQVDFSGAGFEWIDFRDETLSVVAFLRKPETGEDLIMIAANFTPVPRTNYRFGVPGRATGGKFSTATQRFTAVPVTAISAAWTLFRSPATVAIVPFR